MSDGTICLYSKVVVLHEHALAAMYGDQWWWTAFDRDVTFFTHGNRQVTLHGFFRLPTRGAA
jgi:hypothetical protein